MVIGGAGDVVVVTNGGIGRSVTAVDEGDESGTTVGVGSTVGPPPITAMTDPCGKEN